MIILRSLLTLAWPRHLSRAPTLPRLLFVERASERMAEKTSPTRLAN